MAQYTENYNLELQQGADFIDVNGLNRNFNTVDGELKNLEDKKASKEHKHKTSDINDFPSSLPASGGNADTVGGKKPSDFAASSHKHTKSDISDFPSSLPASDVPSWAKATTKPSYTASDVGALAIGGKAADSEKVDGLHVMVLTQAAYDALATKDANTLYFTT